MEKTTVILLASSVLSTFIRPVYLQQQDINSGIKRCNQTIILNLGSNAPQCECSKLKRAPVDYVQRVPGQFYKYHAEPKDWYDAWYTCRNEGGHLAVFNSEAEAAYVGALPKTTFNWAFVGFHDMFKEGVYITIFDQSLDDAGFNKWPSTDPNGGRSENCGVAFPNGLLGDWRCEAPTTFFCEIDIC